MSRRQDPPSFLDLPTRDSKPRTKGITHVLDKGLPLSTVRSMLDLAGPHIDIVKLGWGTAYVSGDVQAKVEAYRAEGIRVSPGGTLLEIAAAQRRVDEFASWVRGIGMDAVEVSDGAVGLEPAAKLELIHHLAQWFTVLVEVGSKDPAALVIPEEWGAAASQAVEAGAEYVILEGRESGNVGLYLQDGTIREALVESLLAEVPTERLLFEAPRKSQQGWFIKHLGPEVNLGNIPPEEVLGVETFRRGLRADTVWLSVRSFGESLVARTMFERSC